MYTSLFICSQRKITKSRRLFYKEIHGKHNQLITGSGIFITGYNRLLNKKYSLLSAIFAIYELSHFDFSKTFAIIT